MELTVYNSNGEKTTRTVSLREDIFGIEPNDHAIYLDVKQFLANQRQGTHDSRERSEISGSTRKLKRQKGTGGARAGDINNPLFRGGGRVFGPHPRDYGFKLNKKVKRLARISALTYKAKNEEIVVLEDFTFDTPKTRNYVEMLKNLNLHGKKTLLVLPGIDKNLYLSMRNLQKANITRASDLNTYDILDAKALLVMESSLKEIEQLYANNQE